ncbi:MAG: DUF4262 domain-containing protein [Jiangellaceae bacterium]
MPSRSTVFRKLMETRKQITARGWAFARGPYGGYTVGMSRHEGHPELLVAMMCDEHVERLLLALTRQIASGRRFAPGDVIEVEGVIATFVAVDRPRECVLLADQLYRVPGGPPVRALQVVVRDQEGWPWDPAYAATRSRDLLGSRPAWAA